jgi:hypothetical protein
MTDDITATGSRSVLQIRPDLFQLCCLKTIAKSRHDDGGRYNCQLRKLPIYFGGFWAHNLVGMLCVLILRVPGDATFCSYQS